MPTAKHPKRKRRPQRKKLMDRFDLPHTCAVDDVEARCEFFALFALQAAAEANGAPLTDDEVEAVLDLCGWYMLALAHGMSPAHAAEAFRTEARGQQTFH
jgi:hypothetical protein